MYCVCLNFLAVIALPCVVKTTIDVGFQAGDCVKYYYYPLTLVYLQKNPKAMKQKNHILQVKRKTQHRKPMKTWRGSEKQRGITRKVMKTNGTQQGSLARLTCGFSSTTSQMFEVKWVREVVGWSTHRFVVDRMSMLMCYIQYFQSLLETIVTTTLSLFWKVISFPTQSCYFALTFAFLWSIQS